MSNSVGDAVGKRPAPPRGDMVGERPAVPEAREVEERKRVFRVPLIEVPLETFKSISRFIMYGMMMFMMVTAFSSALPVIQQLMPLVGAVIVLMIPLAFFRIVMGFGGG